MILQQWQLDTVRGGPVHDGDSFHVLGELTGSVELEGVPGFEKIGPLSATLVVHEMVRLAHCNAAELGTPQGEAAKASVIDWFIINVRGANVPLELRGRDKYQRLLADVVLADGRKLSDFVLALPGSVPMELHDQLA